MRLANDMRVMCTLVDSMTTMLKRLTVRELRNIAKELKNADLGVVQEVVVREVQKEQQVHFFRGLYAFHFGLPTNLKLATCAAISEGTPRVPLPVGMSLLLLATLGRLSGVPGILRTASHQQRIEHPCGGGWFNFALLALAG